ncbi:MAG TPA: MauE/DoxX family redox-associated membrane protein [Actinomycetota bacterium]|nr:MauE/DoxX family redox-associated membrane protein [Actinomycetota bacterium]
MTLVLVCRILLAIVLAGAGIGKLQDLDDSRQQVVDFGLPYSLARPIGTLLPGLELAIGVALLIGPLAWWAAWAALGLVGAFALGIGWNMAVGRRPDCRCFGSLHIATIGWKTLCRNLLLMALAAVVLARL